MPETRSGPEGRYAEQLNNMYSSIDNYTKILAESMLYDLRQLISERIVTAGKNTRLDACDDKIYDAYVRLCNNYKAAAAQYDIMSDVLVSPRIKNIMQGIQSIIYSRFQDPDDLTLDPEQNPILLEKKAIINESVASFEQSFDMLCKDFMENLNMCRYARTLFIGFDAIDYTEAGEKLLRYIALEQENALCEDINTAYQDAVKACIERLSDISAALRYNELLEKERGILGAILEIQVPQLSKACSPTEEAVVGSILSLLAAAYEKLEQDIVDIHMEAGEPKKPMYDELPNPLWNDRLLKAALAATNYGGFAHCLKEELEDVLRGLERDLGISSEREVSNRLCARAMYEYRKQVTANILMAGEMLRVFERLCEFGEKLGSDDPIIDGITETIKIKIESLSENMNVFSENASEKLKNLSKARPAIELKDIGAFESVTDSHTRAAFFEGFRQKQQRHIALYHEYAAKLCVAFKKEHLLFEIITFEELMNYSVSRLRQRNETEIVLFVKCIDETWDELREILSKNCITEIAPEAHDMFNGREHEVLTAERNSEFNKGEIIKLMNRGYKQDGVILVRANVVAAT